MDICRQIFLCEHNICSFILVIRQGLELLNNIVTYMTMFF